MKICNLQGRRDNKSGYSRVIGNEALGQLLSRVQATVISNGTELERIILSMVHTIEDLEGFISAVEQGNIDNGIFVCPKKCIKKSRYCIPGIEPDLLIFSIDNGRHKCQIVELKDGETFDTKKSSGERKNLESFSQQFGCKIPFTTEWYICCFNQESHEEIIEGLKHCFKDHEVLTGREFCEKILNINYDAIVSKRMDDAVENFRYFIGELLNIAEVKSEIVAQLCEQHTANSRLPDR